MITPFALLLARCGLSHREAAQVLDVRLDTVKSWASGRNPTSPGAMDELRALYRRIETAAADALANRADPDDPAIVDCLARTDADAALRGWPCVGAQAAVIGLVVAQGRPRGAELPANASRTPPRQQRRLPA